MDDMSKYEAALRRIATAIIDWDNTPQTPDTDRLTARYDRYCGSHPGWTVREAEIEAIVGFMATVLEESVDGPAFTCPQCGGHHFGSSFDHDTKKVTGRNCHDEFGKGCHWIGTTPDEGMNRAKPK